MPNAWFFRLPRPLRHIGVAALLTFPAIAAMAFQPGLVSQPGSPEFVGPPAPPEAAPRPPPAEVRGVWVVRTDLTTPAAVSRVVRIAKANGLNTLYVQVRGRGDAYYASALEPRADSLGKSGPEFDPLAQAVREGHAAGLQVHAWVNACYVWSDPRAPKSPLHLVRAHPDWLAVNRAGRRCTVGDKEVFVCPANAAARNHLVAICRDLARRYELDGLQLDYIRYPHQNYCFCDGCLQRFEARLTPKITPMRMAQVRALGKLGLATSFPSSWGDYRRDQVTALVQAIRMAVKAERPAIRLSAAVIPWGARPADFRRSEAYNLVAQDWYGWMRGNLVDAVCPMTYQPSLAGFRSWVDGVQRDHPDFPVYFGIGAYLFGPESAATKVEAVRRAGGKGWVLFSYTSVTKSGANDAYLRALKARVIPSGMAQQQ